MCLATNFVKVSYSRRVSLTCRVIRVRGKKFIFVVRIAVPCRICFVARFKKQLLSTQVTVFRFKTGISYVIQALMAVTILWRSANNLNNVRGKILKVMVKERVTVMSALLFI